LSIVGLAESWGLQVLNITLRAMLLASACLVPLLPVAADAQGRRPVPRGAPEAGGAVSAVEVRGNARIDADTVRSYMLIQPGDSYDGDYAAEVAWQDQLDLAEAEDIHYALSTEPRYGW